MEQQVLGFDTPGGAREMYSVREHVPGAFRVFGVFRGIPTEFSRLSRERWPRKGLRKDPKPALLIAPYVAKPDRETIRFRPFGGWRGARRMGYLRRINHRRRTPRRRLSSPPQPGDDMPSTPSRPSVAASTAGADDPRCIPHQLSAPLPVGDECAYPAYSPEEQAIWRELHARQVELLPGRAADEFLTGLRALDLDREKHSRPGRGFPAPGRRHRLAHRPHPRPARRGRFLHLPRRADLSLHRLHPQPRGNGLHARAGLFSRHLRPPVSEFVTSKEGFNTLQG
jgi:hypothetical protein